ncbi:MAG TPA: signal peptidase II [Rhabdochlamydiaceae bacterium]|nr:signal peptidase II [Rhabdochlamydiaceae bacterium]
MTWKGGLKLLCVALSILALDFVSKGMVNFYVQPIEHAPIFFPFGGISVFQDFFGIDFCIHHVTNRGAAWGIGSGLQDALLFVRIAVVLGLIVYLRFSSKAYQYRYPLAMIVAGGLGNILDYFIYGHVIDMFHFFFWGYSYPVFNIADSSIFLGIIWLLLHSFARKKDVIPQT